MDPQFYTILGGPLPVLFGVNVLWFEFLPKGGDDDE